MRPPPHRERLAGSMPIRGVLPLDSGLSSWLGPGGDDRPGGADRRARRRPPRRTGQHTAEAHTRGTARSGGTVLMSEANPIKQTARKVADALKGDGAGPEGGIPGKPGSRSPSDRKSTRLNSSHMSISYAVFCLKKK